MTRDEHGIPTPTQAQAEDVVRRLLDGTANTGENLVTRLKVTQYVSWRPRFDEMKDLQAAAGIANARVFYSIGDESILAVLADITGFWNAQAWAQGGWRAAIPADGTEGTPVVYFGTVTDQGSSAVKLAGHFKVNDYPKWHELFLFMEGSRVASGITNPDIFRSSEDGNDVLVLWDMADGAKARAWMVEDVMTGYPAATGAGSAIVRFFAELGPETQQETGSGN